MDDDLCGRQPLGEDDLLWKATFGGRQPLVEEDFLSKMTFGGRQTSVIPPLDSHSTTEPKLELLSAVSTRNRICHHRTMYAALYMHKATYIFLKWQILFLVETADSNSGFGSIVL